MREARRFSLAPNSQWRVCEGVCMWGEVGAGGVQPHCLVKNKVNKLCSMSLPQAHAAQTLNSGSQKVCSAEHHLLRGAQISIAVHVSSLVLKNKANLCIWGRRPEDLVYMGEVKAYRVRPSKNTRCSRFRMRLGQHFAVITRPSLRVLPLGFDN